MTVQDAAADPNSQLMDQTLPALAQMEASLADELEASRLAVHSANLLDTLTNLGHAIAEESEQLDALDLIAPGSWAAEEFHSRIISWLLDPSAHHGQAAHSLRPTGGPPRNSTPGSSAGFWTHRRTTGKPGTSSSPCSTRQWLRQGCSMRIGASPKSPRSGRTSSTDSGASWIS